MGNVPGGLSPEEVEQIQGATNLTQEDLLKLHRRFKKIDTDGSGSISRAEFADIPGLTGNPLLDRVLEVFDTDHDGEIQFSEFLHNLAIFNQREKREEKLKFAFNIYDIDRDGYISNGELFMVLKKMVGNNLTEVQLQQIVDKTIIEADKDGDGKVSFDEFKGILDNTDAFSTKMSIDISSTK